MLREPGGGGMKGGFGTASIQVGDVIIGAAMVLNGVGDIVDYHTGKIIAGVDIAVGRGFWWSDSELKHVSLPSPQPRLHSSPSSPA
jgi:L-aminopeptidase/D-esterase-like protein